MKQHIIEIRLNEYDIIDSVEISDFYQKMAFEMAVNNLKLIKFNKLTLKYKKAIKEKDGFLLQYTFEYEEMTTSEVWDIVEGEE